MRTMEVFDPALCCSSGVCGVNVDQALVAFAADVDWAKGQGARVERFNLAQQPLEFAKRAAVTEALEREGNAALPLSVVDGNVVLAGRYPTRDELKQWLGLSAQPEPAAFAAVPVTSCCQPAAGKSGCC